MNRETKRMLQRQGQVGPDGTPLATPRSAQPRSLSSRSPNAPRTTPLAYLRDIKTELKKVSWPSRLEVRNYSTVVLFTLVVLIAIIFFLDSVFFEASDFLFK